MPPSTLWTWQRLGRGRTTVPVVPSPSPSTALATTPSRRRCSTSVLSLVRSALGASPSTCYPHAYAPPCAASALTASEAPTPVLVVPGTMSLQGKKNVQLGCPTLFDLSQPPSAAALLLSWNEISTSLTLLVGDVANGGTDSDGAVPDALTHGTLTLTAVKVNGVTAKLVRPARIDIDVVNAFRQAMGPSQPQAAAWDSARRVLVEAGESVQVPPRTYWARVMSCPPPEGGEPRLLQRLGLVLLPS